MFTRLIPKIKNEKNNQNNPKRMGNGGLKQVNSSFINPSVIWMLSSALIFSVLTFVIYSNTFDSPFVFDDIAKIKDNPDIRLTDLSLQKILKAAFGNSSSKSRPVGNLTFALNYYFNRYNVNSYHAVNISIHILAGLFLYLFLKITLKLPGVQARYKHPEIIAFFAAMIWLAHPIATQSVTYIVQRLNSLAALFFVLSFYLFVRGRLAEQTAKKWSWFSGAGLSWVLALGCKQNAATLPVIIFLYEWYFFQDLSPKWFKSSLKYIIAVAVIFTAVAFLYLGTDPLGKIDKLRDFSHGEFTLAQRALTQTRVVVYYLSLIFFPHPSRLNLDYDFPLSYSLFNPITTLFSLILIIGLIVLAFYLAKKERLISFCILWFFGNLLIESSIIPLAIIFEYRTYLPSMLVCLVPVVLIYRYIRFDWLKIGLPIVLIAGLSVWTYQRNRVWENELTLWSDVVKKSPNKARPNHNLGMALANQGMLDKAIAQYQKALQADPKYYESNIIWGKTLENRGQIDAAGEQYLAALRIKPNSSVAHNNLGVVLYKKGQFSEAIDHFMLALQIRQSYEEAYFNLGMVLARQGKTDEAISRFYQTIRLNPDYAEAHSNLGSMYLNKGDADKAIFHSNEALRLNPKLIEPRNNIGIALMQQGKMAEAIRQFQRTLELKPDFIQAENNLKRALAIQKEFEEEISRLQELLKDNPENVELHFQLGNLYFRKGDQLQAMQQYKKAIQLNPKFVPALNNLALVSTAKKEYYKALTIFFDVLKYTPDDARIHYNIACMYSRLNRVNESVEWLQKAIDNGYANWENIKKDNDLDNIRESSAYKKLIQGN
jgi:tetratricopeptide (TPR) repeat protein